MKIYVVAALVASLGLSSCATPSMIVAKTYTPTNPSAVQILFERPSREHEIIAQGSVHAVGAGSASGNKDKAVQGLLNEAARIGGDAVIIQGGVQQSTFSSSIFSGNAYANAFGGNFSGFGTTVTGGAGDATINARIIKFKQRLPSSE